MKITDILGSNIDALINQKKIQKNSAQQNIQVFESKKNAPQDSVNISQIAKVLANLAEAEVSHQKRLEEVQKAYENGTYKPNVQDLAKSILEEIKNG